MLLLLIFALTFIAPTVFVYFLVIKGTDRYEPEPLWLLSMAFFWGAVVATVTAIVGNALGEGAMSLALVGALLAMASTMAAIAMDLDASILRANTAALASAVIFGVPGVLLWGALGAAWAAVLGDLAMAVVYWFALRRADTAMRPRLLHSWKSVAASA